MSKTSIDALLASLRLLQTTTSYSDLTIFCRDENFKVHRAILCPRSRFFATACNWGKHGELKSEITLYHDDPSLVRLVVDYFYQLGYDGTLRKAAEDTADPIISKEPDSPVATSVAFYERLGQVGDQSTVGEGSAVNGDPVAEDTRVLSRSRFSPPPAIEEELPDYWSLKKQKQSDIKSKKREKKKKTSAWKEDNDGNADYQSEPLQQQLQDENIDLDRTDLATNVLMYALADKYETDDLKELALTKFSHAAAKNWRSRAFAYAAGLICETTPKSDMGLRNVVVEMLEHHRDLLDFEEIQQLLDSGNGLAWGLLKLICG